MSDPWQDALTRTDFNRRAFLRGAAAVTLPLFVAVPGFAQPAPAPALITRQREPANLEFPFSTLDNFSTPNDRFYVRNHFPIPRLEARTWRLRVEGAVERELELTFDQLRQMPSRSVTATLECAGNSRAFLTPAVSGVPWELGAVSNASWTGVSLAAVLERAGVRQSAVEVVLEGADRGEVREEPRPPGAIAFARSLPLAKARQADVLLAYRMNDAELPAAHGFPVRVVVPGWYGMASVKWLTRIVVTDQPFQGFFQTSTYTIFERRHGLPVLTPITQMLVKALIARPRAGETLARNAEVRVFGAAWTGESEITRVEVSTDGGQTWAAARLLAEPVRHAWRLWEWTWRTPAQAGRVTLLARATDARGHTQPRQRDQDRRNYLVNHLLPVEVQVS
jgi:DMSO/TMAO reductase YedYZ molybdopterin-dependent catalytic subunit